MGQMTASRRGGDVDFEAFLGLGALVGGIGWGATQLLTWWPGLVPVSATLAAVAVWVVLAAGMTALCLGRCVPGILRSRPVLVWTTTGTAAMALTLGGLFGYVSPELAYWYAWGVACTVGYLATGLLFVRATDDDRLYATAGELAPVLVLVGALAFDALAPVRYLPLAVVHVVPLVLGAYGPRRGWTRPALLLAVFVAVLGVGLAL
jgi:hypothetical protein